MHFGYRVVV